MRLALYTVAWASLGLAQAQSPQAFVGRWTGDSTCVQAESACRNEVVVYDITAAETQGAFSMRAWKVVGGEQQSMGELPCTAAPDGASATCNYPQGAVWTWHVHGTTMTGELRLRGQLFRRIRVQRAPAT